LCLVLSGTFAKIATLPAEGLGANSENFNGYQVCTDHLFREIVVKARYPLESYRVKTDDGFMLRLYRMQAKDSQISNGKKVALLQHGIFDSADNFVINGEQNSLAFVLANKGYDVWVSNSRGNKYSRAHAWLNPKSKEFWDYSFQEMGEFDIKANINFILQKTGAQKLTYIGHSQGTTQMFAALGSNTASFINSKVNKFIALAPVVLPRKLSSPIITKLASDTILAKALQVLGITELLPGGCSKIDPVKWMTGTFCTLASAFCQIFLGFTDDKPSYNNGAITGIMAYYFPSGSSVRSLLHFQQLINQKDESNPRFLMYDFGAKLNQQKYGSPSAPVYDFGKIKIPVSLFIGKQDKLATVSDNNVLAGQLRSKGINTKTYYYDNCGHSTFVWAKDASKIFGDVLTELASA
jgi:gastric triacylglycerol lipase